MTAKKAKETVEEIKEGFVTFKHIVDIEERIEEVGSVMFKVLSESPDWLIKE